MTVWQPNAGVNYYHFQGLGIWPLVKGDSCITEAKFLVPGLGHIVDSGIGFHNGPPAHILHVKRIREKCRMCRIFTSHFMLCGDTLRFWRVYNASQYSLVSYKQIHSQPKNYETLTERDVFVSHRPLRTYIPSFLESRYRSRRKIMENFINGENFKIFRIPCQQNRIPILSLHFSKT
jgi:hypothetical protein